jgi:DNA gyrase/topoisomerase IV subunit B
MVSNISRRKRFKPRFPKRVQKLWEKSKTRDFYYIRFKDGKFKEDGFINDLSKLGLAGLEQYSTIIRFLPDTSIIGTAESPVPENLKYVMKILQLKGRKAKVTINGEPYAERMPDYKYPIRLELKGSGVNPKVELLGSFEISDDIFRTCTEGTVNGAVTPRGRHIELFQTAFLSALKTVFGKEAARLDYSGIRLFLIMLANEADFSSQAKTYLSRVPEFDMAQAAGKLSALLAGIMKDNHQAFKLYFHKLINFAQQKANLNEAKDIDTLLGTKIKDDSEKERRKAMSALPSKLVDAYGTNRAECELFLVEGLSAASDFKKYRDPKIHAVLPLRGVPLNAGGMKITDVLRKSQELRDMVNGIGSGVDGNYNLKRLRYGKIIIATDGDPDGQRIAALLCGMFGAHCKYLLENGNIYMAVSPYYIQDGKFFYPGEDDKLNRNRPFKRIKGLGSLGKDFPGALINPKTRRLVRITAGGLAEALLVLTDGAEMKKLLVGTGALALTALK